MIGQSLQRIVVFEAGSARHVRVSDAPMQHAARRQTNRLVDGIARDPVLEAQAAAGRIGEEKIRFGERAQRVLVRRAAAGCDQRTIGRDIADDGGGAHDVGLLFRQTPKTRGHQRADPAAAAARGQRLRQLLGRCEVTQFLDVERHAAGVIVDARDQEGIGLRQPATDGARRFRAVEGSKLDVRRAGDQVRAFMTCAAGQQDTQPNIRLQKRGHQSARGVVRPLPVVDDQRHAIGRRAPG